jgi:polyisoprenoid-binding protein YceI
MNARFLAAVLLSTPWLLSDSAKAAQYTIDPSHASVQFRISHLGFSTMTGRFDKFAGHFEWDEAHPERASVEITIDTASINTNWAERDKHLREPRYLGVEAYPEASFRSTSYTGDANGGKLLGELTLHGVTRTLGIDIKRVGEGHDPWGDYRAGFDGTATLRRADYGVGYDLGPTAQSMEFDLHVEGIRGK